jgi:hypothetical protein
MHPLHPKIIRRWEIDMSASYFRLKAARLLRSASSSIQPPIEHGQLTALAHEFQRKAKAARERLAHARAAFGRRQEAERQGEYSERRE